MSKIRRLSITNIRNFGDNDDSEITFKCPITLILGENGTGKTTIIECLKFATTGDYPPNSDRGKSFVSDPSLGSSSMTKANVRLEFTNKREQRMTAARSLELKRTATSFSISTLDNTLSLYNPETRKHVNINHRCADTNNLIIESMGVSKAILNYVIFCHQDESFWPIEGGKELKAKLDEIFGTAKHNKALEALRTLNKNSLAKIKDLKITRAELKGDMNNIETKRNQLKADKERRDKQEDKINEINSKIQVVENNYKKIEETVREHEKQNRELEKRKTEYEYAEKEISYMQSNIDKVFEGSDEALQEKIESFATDFSEKSRKIAQDKIKLREGNSKEEEDTKLLNHQKVNVGTLKQKMEDQRLRVTKRNEILKGALKNWNIECSSEITEKNAKDLTKKLSEKLEEYEKEADCNRIKREREEKSKQTQIDHFLTEKSKISHELHIKEQECEIVQSDLKKIREDIKNAGTASIRLREAESKLEKATEKYEQIKNETDVTAIKQEINENMKNAKEAEKNVKDLNSEIASLTRQNQLQTEINLHQSNHTAKTDKIEEIRQKHKEGLKLILEKDEIPMEKLRSSVEKAQQKLNTMKRNMKSDIEATQQQVTTLKTTLKHQETELEKNIEEIKSEKKTVSNYCDYDEYDEALKLQTVKLKELRDKMGLFSYQRIAYDKYLAEITDNKPCCPLCTRDFSEKNEVIEFKKSIRLQMEKNPDAMKSCEKELKSEEAKYDSMLQLKPTVDKILRFENTQFKQKKQQIEETKKKLQSVQEKLEELNKLILEPEKKLKLCDTVITDTALWDQCIDEIEKLGRKIKALRSSLQHQMKSTRTLESAQEELENYQEKLSSYREQIELLQAKIEDYNIKEQDSWRNKKLLEEKVFSIKNEMQKVTQLRDKEKELNAKQSNLNESIVDLREKEESESINLSLATEELEKFKLESQNIQKNIKNIIQREHQASFKLRNCQTDIDEFIKYGYEEQIKECEKKINEITEKLNRIKDENVKLAKELQQCESSFLVQQRIEKQLKDNVELRKKQKELEKSKQDYMVMKKKLDSNNYREQIAEMQHMEGKRDSYIQKRSEALGLKNELDRIIQEMESFLNSPLTKQKTKDYVKTCSDIIVTQNSLDDLQIYMGGMDHAMSEYHKDRMNAVNDIMSKMWRAVYKGSDTKGIQIKTESTGKMDSARRVFNYKLVQIKHGIEMEMKGRCSAGQKVLASIIIRMALAEAFCGDCGVLALDEPTTNLDVHNARSLAHALLKIVESRSIHQKNFQLILITHDEEFLRVLAKLDPDNSYYKLSRSEQTGRTIISRKIAGHEMDNSTAS